MPKRAGRPPGAKDSYLTLEQQRQAFIRLRDAAEAGDRVAQACLLTLSMLNPNKTRRRRADYGTTRHTHA